MNPTGVFVVTVAMVLASLLGLILVRWKVPRTWLAEHTEVAGFIYAVIGVIYGVILAQVVVAAWDEFRDAEAAAASEASSVRDIARLARGWPDDDRTAVEAALDDYARHVINVEWPAMMTGDFQATADPTVVDQLWAAVDAADRNGVGTRPSYAATLDQLDQLDDARRSRLLLGQSGLPGAMTVTLALGAIITVTFTYLFAVESGWMHSLMTASLSVLVALLLLLVYELETPFTGVSAIEPTAMQLVLEDMERAELGPGTVP
jgi:hypothetical protein